jgi:hypothetical protein
LLAIAVPDSPVTPVVMVAVYKVLLARAVAGVKVATLPEASYVTVPVTAVVPGPASVKVEVLIVAGAIASLKVARMAWLTGTLTARLAGTVEMTVGAAVAGAVIKLHT